MLKADGLLLRRIPYGETSLVVHVITADHGKLSLMASGARRKSSPMRAALAPLHLLRLQWQRGRTGMGRLLKVERGRPIVPESHWLSAMEVLALAYRLFHEADPQAFATIMKAMEKLVSMDEQFGKLAAVWHLFGASGWLGDFEHCWRCEGACTRPYWSRGHLHCRKCGPGRPLPSKLSAFLRGQSRFSGVDLDEGDAAFWRWMIRDLARHHGLRDPFMDM